MIDYPATERMLRREADVHIIHIKCDHHVVEREMGNHLRVVQSHDTYMSAVEGACVLSGCAPIHVQEGDED